MKRGEIWWASLRPPRASEPGYRRPVVIVSSDRYNESRIRTVIAVILTSNLALAAAPGNVKCSRRATGLPRDSVANISQIYTVDRDFLRERIGVLRPDLLREIDDGLRLVLAL